MNSQMIALGISGLRGKEVGSGARVTVHAGKGGSGLSRLTRVNYVQSGQDSPSSSLPFVVMSK